MAVEAGSCLIKCSLLLMLVVKFALWVILEVHSCSPRFWETMDTAHIGRDVAYDSAVECFYLKSLITD